MDLTKLLAIYAAILSTAVFMWNVSRSRPKFTVKLALGLDKCDEDYVSGVYISLQNTSSHTVHINQVRFVCPYRKVTLWDRIEALVKYRRFGRTVGWVHTGVPLENIDTGLPISLEAGNSHMIFIPDEVIEEMLDDSLSRKFVVQAQDALWRNKASATFRMPKSVQKSEDDEKHPK